MGLLDRLFGRRGDRGSGGGRSTRDESPQNVQPLPVDPSGGQAESQHHGGHDAGGQQDPGQGPHDPGSQNTEGGWDAQGGFDSGGGDSGGGDSGGGFDSGGGDSGGGDGGGGGGGD